MEWQDQNLRSGLSDPAAHFLSLSLYATWLGKKKKKIRLSQPFLRSMSPDAQNIILVHGVLNPQRQSHAYRYKPVHCALVESPPWLPHLFQSHRTQNKHWTGVVKCRCLKLGWSPTWAQLPTQGVRFVYY